MNAYAKWRRAAAAQRKSSGSGAGGVYPAQAQLDSAARAKAKPGPTSPPPARCYNPLSMAARLPTPMLPAPSSTSIWTPSSSPWKNCSIRTEGKSRSRGRPARRARRGFRGFVCGAQVRRALGHAAAHRGQTVSAGYLRQWPSRPLPRMFGKVHKSSDAFSPQVGNGFYRRSLSRHDGTARLHGPPLKAAHTLHQRMKTQTQLNCSVGIGTSRLIAKVSSAQAKPNGVLWIVPGEAKFLAPLDVREIPGVGKVMESHLHALGIRKVGDLARLDGARLERALRQVGTGAGGQSARRRCRRMVRRRSRRRDDAKSI